MQEEDALYERFIVTIAKLLGFWDCRIQKALSRNGIPLHWARSSLHCHLYQIHQAACPFAFYSSQVDVILEGLKEMVCRVDVKPLVVPVVLMLLGTVGGGFGEEYVKRQWWDTVNAVGQVDIIKSGSMFIGICSHTPH